MEDANPNGALEQARALSRFAAQWLERVKFRSHAVSTVFSPSLSHYHDMLDPAATDAARLSSCRRMRKSVLRRVNVEDLEGEAAHAGQRPVDPYRLHWRTTRDGATFAMIAHLLSVAIDIFETEGVTA